MTYKNFEEVPVWQDGIELSARTFAITEDKAFRNRGDIANQIQRAGLSIPNNISEGFERGTTAELITFLYYSKGSAGEVRSICHVIDRLPCFAHLKSEIADLKSRATSVSRQLNGWISSLQETDIKGHRHLTEKSRETYQGRKKADAFMAELKQEQEERLRRMQEERQARAGSGPIES
jgi:four helix bundle protein